MKSFKMCPDCWGPVVALLLLVVICVSSTHGGSCREASLCCNGRDSSCVVQKAPLNAIIEDLNDKPCYCDHACLRLGDCCDDFKAHCGVIDCVVSEWGPWSDCDTACGTGMMSRTRIIEHKPQNGGKHCPSLLQKRGCQGLKCHNHHDRKVLRETALLLPAILSKSRHENDTSDIRRNLRLRYKNAFKHNRGNEYCIEFEVIKATKACHKDKTYSALAEGDRVTVRCDLEALHEEKSVTLEPEISNNSIQEEDDNDGGSRQTVDKKPKFRCRGEGTTGRSTQFTSLALPSCRGKWMRVTSKQVKKCSAADAEFIFV
ncbi:somatomedin-B and thrombospondin type-1 domain-containing protein [Topomyia yanbarensis]|uniref:somatomedin-B and thrombospondin type-1 domain-containing protein n=1 Tax=Topomyia yanbarensis TaxID=2498891 RepID=UPI00273C801C|nr:somatomedin-B and thrombospondin type-1 domain-containing protein [Topomyia yanbarensis]XP_058837381.1 somatomedin-B and thrombospondin type-1 domain-containing protein [Topomyia yanbarensis]XP_058837382.1 somatomedin-B and thrombospondin type-1 domain-containing protein [Topomyia yanbarensis]XP_058837383.1 somatomedin-B and thrombospondin type-1 domain-containing protein [Topomyia yanbarensis]XP_058837384.1 somatomedin-B and thrombospondin type-1 domain-containing protein [Topomyia yanbaren